MKKIILSFSVALLTSTPVWAINCQIETDCSTLGYTSDKNDGDCLKCPFGNKWACPKCETSNYCEIGYILYSDKTIHKDFISNKTPIGVVFDCNRQLAVALNSSSYKEAWATEQFDIPNLKNYDSDSAEAKTDFQGKENSKIITEYCKSKGINCPAFEYVNSYKTEGTSAGDWYLPSMGELNVLYNYKGVLNVALQNIGGAELSVEYWSSTEANANSAWTLNFRDYNSGAYYKTIDRGYVRPVLAF